MDVVDACVIIIFNSRLNLLKLRSLHGWIKQYTLATRRNLAVHTAVLPLHAGYAADFFPLCGQVSILRGGYAAKKWFYHVTTVDSANREDLDRIERNSTARNVIVCFTLEWEGWERVSFKVHKVGGMSSQF